MIYLDTSNVLWVSCPFCSRKKFKTDFQDGRHGRNLGFLIATIWAIFLIYKSPRCFLPSFKSIGFSVQKKKGKIDFQDGHHLGFLIGTILAIFISTSHPDASYQFSNQLALWFRKISEKKSFKLLGFPRYFRSTPQCFLPSFKSNGLSVQEKWKIDFQDGCHGGHLEFLIGTILAIFDLQVTLMLPTCTYFKVNKPFGSGEVKNRFSRWPPWRPSWVPNRNDFSHFWSISHPDASYQVSGVVGWCEGVVYLALSGRPTDIGLQLGKACYPCSR